MVGKHWIEEHDRAVLRLGTTTPTAAAIARLAGQIGHTPLAVRRRWEALQRRDIPKRGGPTRDWTEQEEAFLRDTIGWRAAESIAAALGRTPLAVRIKAKRLGLHWVKRQGKANAALGLTARDVQGLLGLSCAKTVTWWIAEGWLSGTKREIAYGEHTIWRIHPSALEAFLREYRWLYDPARIRDRGWRAFVASLPPAPFVGVREAARLLPYTIGGISQMIRKGDLPAEKWGPNWRIPLAAIHAFVPPPFGYGHDRTIAASVSAKRRAVLATRKTGRKAAEKAQAA